MRILFLTAAALSAAALFAANVPAKADLDGLTARTAKIRFEAREIASQLKDRSSNPWKVQQRMQWVEENAAGLRALAPALDALPPNNESQQIRQRLTQIDTLVRESASLLTNSDPETHRKQLREKAEALVKQSELLQQSLDRIRR